LNTKQVELVTQSVRLPQALLPRRGRRSRSLRSDGRRPSISQADFAANRQLRTALRRGEIMEGTWQAWQKPMKIQPEQFDRQAFGAIFQTKSQPLYCRDFQSHPEPIRLSLRVLSSLCAFAPGYQHESDRVLSLFKSGGSCGSGDRNGVFSLVAITRRSWSSSTSGSRS
jgi:hypothetical protein